MRLRIRYLLYGTASALAALLLGVLISSLLNLNWVVICVLLLALTMLAILSNTLSSAGGGPTMRPAAGGSNPWSVTTSSLSLQELQTTDHMMEESGRQGTRHMPKESRYRWMALPSVITILAILLGAFL